MKTIYLLRHAEADHHPQDHERPLTQTGQKQAAAVARFMTEHHHKPDLVLVSDALRTQQTAGHFTDFETEETHGLYLASTDALLDHITMTPDHLTHVMLIAHNPGLADLALTLSVGHEHEITSFRPATLMIFNSTADTWMGVDATNTKPVGFYTPENDDLDL